MATIRVLIVDDHRLVAQAMADTLDASPGIEVLGTQATARDGVLSATQTRPDVVLMDLQLPDSDGITATREILRASPETKVVMVTGSLDESALEEALGAGCVGFVTKGSEMAELVAVVHAAHAGEIAVSKDQLPKILKGVRSTPAPPGPKLTPREMEILHLLARGLANETIGSDLGLSVFSVRKHVQNIIAKLDSHSKLQAVATAVRRGIVGFDSIAGPGQAGKG